MFILDFSYHYIPASVILTRLTRIFDSFPSASSSQSVMPRDLCALISSYVDTDVIGPRAPIFESFEMLYEAVQLREFFSHYGDLDLTCEVLLNKLDLFHAQVCAFQF